MSEFRVGITADVLKSDGDDVLASDLSQLGVRWTTPLYVELDAPDLFDRHVEPEPVMRSDREGVVGNYDHVPIGARLREDVFRGDVPQQGTLRHGVSGLSRLETQRGRDPSVPVPGWYPQYGWTLARNHGVTR